MPNIEAHIAEIKAAFAKEDLTANLRQDEWARLQKQYLKTHFKDLYASLKGVTDGEEKKAYGQQINALRGFLEEAFKNAGNKKAAASQTFYDPSLIKQTMVRGKLHPLTKFYKQIEQVFVGMGFHIAQGPEIERDINNFEKLNIPPHHPARDMQDTFYVRSPELLLRSHTSCVQIRTMEKSAPPIKIISPGTVYRVDDIDPQHTPMFYQVEGLVVAEGSRFSDLKGVLIEFLHHIFGSRVEVRFRPSYYPYTEPSAAIDLSCLMCNSVGCRTCGNSGWITILGSGMVHPNVLQAVGYDSEKYTGFAFGLGINRLAMIYYHLPEIRAFYENNISLWEQL